MSDAAAPPPADLRLRARLPPVARLSRRSLVLLAGAAAVVVCGAVGIALTFHPRGAAAPAPFSVDPRPPEAVQTLPADYRGPRLGPSLPGDLGGAIVAAQGSEPAAKPSTGSKPTAERDRQALEAARGSQIFLPDRSGGLDAMPRSLNAGPEPDLMRTTAPAEPGPNGLPANPARLAGPSSAYVLQAGAVIPAALVTGIRSDIPGQVIAQVTEPVFDTPTGRVLLIPQGARLLGAYERRVDVGQRRLHLIWTRLILPNGRSLQLGQASASDVQGYAGLQDRVDRRWRSLFGMAALSTILAFGAELGADDESDLVRALRRGGADSFNQTGQQAVGQALQMAPVLTIRPGSAVRMIVTRDLVLEPYSEPTHD